MVKHQVSKNVWEGRYTPTVNGKRIIAFLNESGRAPTYTVMLNPEIIKKDGAYDTEEGCLSLLGVNAIKPSRCSIRPWRYKHARKTSLAGLHRSFSTKWIIVMEY